MIYLPPMDTPPPDDLPPPQPPILLPAADLPPMDGASDESPPAPLAWTAPNPPLPARTVIFLTTLGTGAVLYVLLLILGGPGGQFAADGIEVLPFVGLALLAYAGESNDVFRLLAIFYWILLIFLAVIVGIALTGLAEFDVSVLPVLQETSRTGKAPLGGLPPFFFPGGPAKIAVTAIVCIFAALVGALGFTRSARRAAARSLPAFDPESFVHAVALATVVALTLILFASLGAAGEPPFLSIINHFAGADFGDVKNDFAEKLGDANILVDQVYSFMWMVPMGIVVVGWPLHRTLPSALRRVGFVVPKPWHIALALGLAVSMATMMPGLVDPAIGRFWDLMGWPRTDEKAFEQLFKSMNSVIGACVIGVTAGVGEELFARGILQPRLGILLSNLFFVSLHALQYNWDALLSVFIAGLVLGVVRKKTNTTTSAIVHGTYDFLLVLAGYYSIDPSKWFGWG
jgi:uncharacterized protein